MPKKSRNCVKRQRPIWWDQASVVAKLQAGEFIMAICQQAADDVAEMGITLSATTLRAEVSGWAESASWGEQIRAALHMWRKSSSGEMVLSKHWHDDFLAAMETPACNGNAQKAAQLAGVGYGVVLAVLDRRNKCYDPDFAEKFKIAELARVGQIRERYMVLAEEGEGRAATRAQERLIEAALPSLHGQKQEVHVSGKVEHEHEHVHGISAGLAREVVLASQDRVRKLNAGRQGMLPDDTGGVVIDITPVAQRARA